MNKFKCFYASVVIATLASCTADFDENTGGSARNNVIEVSTYIPATRAIDKTAFEEGDEFSLYACKTTGNYNNTFESNFMNNVAVERGANGNWTYSPVMTWPIDENEHLSFVAFYPKNTNTATDDISYPFTTNSDYTKQTDPLWCTIKDANINDRNGTFINGSESEAAFEPKSGALNLKFRHMLSKINIKVKLAESYPGIKCYLKYLYLSNINSTGRFRISNDLSSGTWYSGTPETFKLIYDGNQPVTTTDCVFDDLLLIPQNLSANGSALHFTYIHTLEDGGEKAISRYFYLPNSWEPNKTYNYSIVLSLNTNSITVSSSIDDWDTPTVTPSIGDEIPNAVDLGLSVKWAACDYWAQIESNKGRLFDLDNCYNYNYDWSWGASWRNPTTLEWDELYENCTITNETRNGTDGYLVTGKNGNSIFLPQTHYATSSYHLDNGKTVGWYYTNVSGKSCILKKDRFWKVGLRPVYTK